MCESKILFVRDDESSEWCFPITYADYRSGESISFASQRLIAQKYKVLPDVVGLLALEQGCPTQQDVNFPTMVCIYSARLNFSNELQGFAADGFGGWSG